MANAVNNTCLSVKCDSDLTKSTCIPGPLAGKIYLNESEIGVGNCFKNSYSIVEKVFPLQEHSLFAHKYLSNNIQWILEPQKAGLYFFLLLVFLYYHNRYIDSYDQRHFCIFLWDQNYK